MERKNKLREWRLAKGVTLKQLAERTGYRYRYLARIEEGVSKGTPNTWIRLARELEVTVNDLFRETKCKYLTNVNEQERLC